jgi:hypothetical protein
MMFLLWLTITLFLLISLLWMLNTMLHVLLFWDQPENGVNTTPNPHQTTAMKKDPEPTPSQTTTLWHPTHTSPQSIWPQTTPPRTDRCSLKPINSQRETMGSMTSGPSL